jgi:uncharacterized protein
MKIANRNGGLRQVRREKRFERATVRPAPDRSSPIVPLTSRSSAPAQISLVQPVCATNGLVPPEQIRAFCQAVAREFHPERIVLFGSYAYGQPTSESDVDLLVILPFRGNDLVKVIQIRSRVDASFPLDLLVRKPHFIAARLQERDMFIELVMTRGVVMYEGQHSRMDH